ncbi:ThiF family adenylyltransferase [Oleidesulfovibrio sp.]|uniref:ThiF family adenylyltransferase n=1 Tax=Oleidesulfovibrio sp. TaxID=2909707 RepID=UPI003A87E8C7
MLEGKDRRRTIRIKRSSLLDCKLGDLDKPAIKVAETLEEYSGAFGLVYDEYRRAGYTQEHPSGLFFNAWSLLPKTAVFIFKSYLEVLSTVTYIPDTPEFGLPIDAVFKDKIDELRQADRNVVEVGALVTQRRRRWSNMMVFLAKAIMRYAELSGADDLVVMVNPKHVRFYTNLMLFKPYGEERFYEKVGAPAVALRIDVRAIKDSLKEEYGVPHGEEDFETNLHHFFVVTNTILPGAKPSFGPDSVTKNSPLSPYAANHLLRARPEVLDSLEDEQRDYLERVYHQALFNEHGGIRKDKTGQVRTPAIMLQNMKLEDRDVYTDTAFCRNLGLLEYAEQRKLLNSRVAIAGLGGVGGEHLVTLARTGFGKFNLAEFDSFSPVNVNRQYGATVSAFGREKLDVMVEYALGINPYLELKTFPKGINDENLEEFLEDVDVVVDGIDFFALDIRRKLFNMALEKGIPVITAGPMGYSSALLVFMPGGKNFDDYFDIHDGMKMEDMLFHFALGLAPRPTHVKYLDRRFVDMRGKRGPSMDIACRICTGMAATEAVKVVLGKKPTRAVPQFTQFDPSTGKLVKSRLFYGLKSPLQKMKLAIAKAFFYPPEPTGAAEPDQPDMCKAGELISQEAFEFIIRAGMQAPSGDNVQPWKFRIGENSIEVFADREADNSFFNVAQVATLMSCGAVVENMEYAAGAIGLHCNITLEPEDKEPDCVAEIKLEPRGVPMFEIAESSLWRRCTNRQPLSVEPVPDEVWSRLESMVSLPTMFAWASQDYYFVDEEKLPEDSPDNKNASARTGDATAGNSDVVLTVAEVVAIKKKIEKEKRLAKRRKRRMILDNVLKGEPLSGLEDYPVLAEAVFKADRVRVERKDLHEYLMKYIRFEPQQGPYGDGLPLKNLQVGVAGELFMRFIKPWSRMEKLLKYKKLAAIIPTFGRLSVMHSGGIGLLSIPDTEEKTFVEAGRVFNRLWCALEYMGYSVQPLAALTLLHLRIRLEGPDAFDPEHVQLLEEADAAIRKVFKLPDAAIPLMMFRTGKMKRVTHRTFRKSLHELLKK